jgi:hypothetical protein
MEEKSVVDVSHATQGAAEDNKRMDNETIRWHLFDLSSDLKMLKQLFREQEAGFPTPEYEVAPMQVRIKTMEIHLADLARELGCDPQCPPPQPMHPLYPLGEGRMSDAEYEQRKKNVAPVSRREPGESMGGMYFRLCERALHQGGLEAAEAVIAEAQADDVFRRIQNGDDDVILFHDESWFDVGLCLQLNLK